MDRLRQWGKLLLLLAFGAAMLGGCGGGGAASAPEALNSDGTKTASVVWGDVTITNPTASQKKYGDFTATVDTDYSLYAVARYVDYYLWDGYNPPVYKGTGWTADNHPKTITVPQGVFAYYQLQAKFHAYDNSGPPYGPFWLDTDTVNFIIDTR